MESHSNFKVRMAKLLISLLVVTIYTLPFFLTCLPIILVKDFRLKLVLLGLAPIQFSVLYVLIAGLLSFPFQKAIVSGIFPRDLGILVYVGRRAYGACLSMVLNFTILYHFILSFYFLKVLFFRIFGYQGESVNFTTYPDAWIRDIPLLTLGNGAYIANQSTLGTNICLTDGNIMVGRIKIGDDTQLGRLCIIGPGARVGANCETGVKTTIGLRTRLSDQVKMAACATFNHDCTINPKAEIREMTYLGMDCEIGEGVVVPAGSFIETGTKIQNQEEMDKIFSQQRKEMQSIILSSINKAEEMKNNME